MSPSWLSAKPSDAAQSTADSHPLLPTHGADDDEESQLEMGRFAVEERKPGLLARMTRLQVAAVATGLLLPAWLTLGPVQLAKSTNHDFTAASHAQVDRLLARQSQTLAQAQARYSVRNRRAPPPGYDRWFGYAKEHSCLVDEYEQITRDFAPFYELAEEDPKFFARMVDKAAENVKRYGRGMTTGQFQDRTFRFTDEQPTLYTSDWPRTFGRFADFMPDMAIILNGRDEPRSAFNVREPDGRAQALVASDPTPFEHSPHPTSSFFKEEMKCIVPNQPTGFTKAANDASAFMLYASSTEFSTDMYPILSMTKISPCFADILVPSEFYYMDSYWAPKYAYENNITWTDKTSKLYWRGMNSGGRMFGDNYHSFPRFRLIDIARKHHDIMDVALSAFHDDLCGDQCDADAIKKEYGIVQASSPREDVYRYKYVFDVDGNSFSGRYFGLLKSGSLVFKSTVFLEYFGEWLRPFEHYIPVLPDLSDLVEKVEWAVAHDEEAQRIQQAGKVFAERVLTDAQNDCYFALVLLEWGRLLDMANTTSSVAGTPVVDGPWLPTPTGDPFPDALD
ncbi:CAP10 domain-containing protein [Mycena kentingensis (nom. inval.)]|nr:CAP10 domain-containing protein [Mycena kentingensis (nom. inval.)]